MTTLHLGVTEMPYGKQGAKTTGDVAGYLETKYGLFTAFVDIHAKVIQFEVENSLRGAMETVMMQGSRRKPRNPFATATSGIELLFKDALTMQTYDFKLPGVPTGAAQAGVSHRKKRPYVSRGPRPSFIDTGLFQSSFRAWTTDD